LHNPREIAVKYLMWFFLLVWLGLGMARAADPIGRVKVVTGTVTVQRDGAKSPLEPGSPVFASDTLLTGKESSVGLTLTDNTLISLGANSHLALEKYAFNSTTHEGNLLMSIVRGTLAVTSGKLTKQSADAVQVKMRTATIGIRGTHFIVEIDAPEE
jgi:hypothetical protein